MFTGIHYQSVLPKGRSYTESAGTKVCSSAKGRSSTATGTKVTILLGMNRCSSFLLLSTLSLASEQTLKDLKRSQGPQHGGEESGFG